MTQENAMAAITVTTSADVEGVDAAYDAAVTQALTISNGAPLTYEGCKPYVAPDKYEGGYTTGYAWTFTPLPQ